MDVTPRRGRRLPSLSVLLWLVASGPAEARKGEPAGKREAEGKADSSPQPPRTAEEELAAAYFVVGSDLYESGEFVEAAKAFERATRKAPERSALLFNVASSYDKAGDRPSAMLWYRKYLGAAHGAKESAVARARMEVLEREAHAADAAAAAAAAATQAAEKRAIETALPFVEPITRHTYSTKIELDGKPYAMLGAASVAAGAENHYCVGLYVEDAPARRAFPRLAASAGGSDHDTLMHNDLGHQFVLLGDFGKAALLHFVHNASANSLRKEFRAGLKDSLSNNAPSAVRKDAKTFLALLSDVSAGADLVIRTTPEGQLILKNNGKTVNGPVNGRLALDLWSMWLGTDAASPELKKALVDRLDTLGR